MKKIIKNKIGNSFVSNATVSAALNQPSTSYISRRSKMNPVVHPHLPFDPLPRRSTQVEQGIQDVDYQIYQQYTNETQEKYDNSQMVYMLYDSPIDVPPVTYSYPPPPLPNDNEQPVESISIHCSESENEESSPDVKLIETTSPVKKIWEAIDKYSPTDVPPVTYSYPPPPLPNNNEQPVESISIHCSESENEGSSPDVKLIESTSPVKKIWETIDKFHSSSDIGGNKTTPKGCQHCQDQEFRLQFNMEKFEKMLLSRQKLDAQISLIDKKIVNLYEIILLFFEKQQNDAEPWEDSLGSR